VLWEMVKVAMTVGMLMAAPKILGAPSWPALLIGLALTIMVYGVGLWLVQLMKSGAKKVKTNGC